MRKRRKKASSAPSSSNGASAPKVEETVEPTAPEPVATTTINAPSGRLIASPRAKKLAKEFKVDLTTVAGTGLNGRITAEDVEKVAGKAPSRPTAAPVSAVTTPPVAQAIAPAPVNNHAGETVPLNTLQQAVVRNMMASLQVPTFHVSYDITTDALDALYRQIKPKGVTMTALLAKAVAVTLQKHSIVNSSYTDAGIKYNEGINIAIAVAIPDGGLITPVLKNADQVDIYSLARSWKDLVSRARAKQLQPDEYSTGTFTISNLGMFGVSSFDAILPPGQGSLSSQ